MTGLPHIDPTEPDTVEKGTATAKRALFPEAKDLLDDQGVFMLAIRALRIRWYGEHLGMSDRYWRSCEFSALFTVSRRHPGGDQTVLLNYGAMAMDKTKHVRRTSTKPRWRSNAPY